MPWWYMSFVDINRPRGNQFLGACLVFSGGEEIADAIKEAWRVGCNPGGAAQVVELPSPLPEKLHPYGNRLLQIPDLLDAGLVTEEFLAERERYIWDDDAPPPN